MLESYCVIQFKDKDEKAKILSYLAAETEAEYKVTNDLKNFVSEKYNVTIVEKDEKCWHKKIDRILIKDEGDINETYQQPSNPVFEQLPNALQPQDWTSYNPTANSNDFIQNVSQYSSTFNSEAYDQYYSAVLNPQSSVETQNGTPTTYPSTTQEPLDPSSPVPIHLDPSNQDQIHEQLPLVTMDDYIDVGDDESIPTQEDVPSSSTSTKSNRSTKRRNLSTDDDSNNKNTPPTKHKRKICPKKKERCKVCETEVKSSSSYRLNHIFKHTSIMRFECMVSGCGVKLKHRNNQWTHTKARHTSETASFRELELTSDERTELDKMMATCFDVPKKNSADECQICKQNAGGKHLNSRTAKRTHAYNHLSFMRFKCMEAECSYVSKLEKTVKMHSTMFHGKRTASNFSTIELTREQELELANIFTACFPNAIRHE